MATMRSTQKELENQILKLLAESEGDILDDENLIQVILMCSVLSRPVFPRKLTLCPGPSRLDSDSR